MRRAARTDATAKPLMDAARDMGCAYLPLNDAIDGVLLIAGEPVLVDWKSPGGTLTERQAKLVAAGWPIKFVSTVEQLINLVASRRHVAGSVAKTPDSRTPLVPADAVTPHD